jgi:hypothetical protein
MRDVVVEIGRKLQCYELCCAENVVKPVAEALWRPFARPTPKAECNRDERSGDLYDSLPPFDETSEANGPRRESANELLGDRGEARNHSTSSRQIA